MENVRALLRDRYLRPEPNHRHRVVPTLRDGVLSRRSNLSAARQRLADAAPRLQ